MVAYATKIADCKYKDEADPKLNKKGWTELKN